MVVFGLVSAWCGDPFLPLARGTPTDPTLILLGTFSILGGSEIDFGGRKNFKNTFNPCSHIELDTQNPIFKITVYCTKHTKNTNIHFLKYKIFEKTQHPYFSKKNRFQNEQRFMAICMARLWLA